MIYRWLRNSARKAKALLAGNKTAAFRGTETYWEERYGTGGNSGAGSYGRLACFKADFLNALVKKKNIQTVIEFGCGDGHQLSLAHYPQYVGLDVSAKAIEICQRRFEGDSSKRFAVYDPRRDLPPEMAVPCELALSLDVIYHLIEDEIFERYMTNLFHYSRRHVVVYSSDLVGPSPAPHVRHRRFTDWVAHNSAAASWRLEGRFANPFPFDPANPGNTSFADFFVFTLD